jgi:hypothetical protein
MMERTPSLRASLNDVMHHPWMMKGYTAMIDDFVLRREGLITPFDPNFII